jgi:ligand-binding sensor domain-containing protein
MTKLLYDELHHDRILFKFQYAKSTGFPCMPCGLFNSLAQQYPFVHYGPKEGLADNRVHKIFQDSKNRMYFLTYEGLSVYDGTRFTNYTTENGLAINLVNDILECGEDSLLLASKCATTAGVGARRG